MIYYIWPLRPGVSQSVRGCAGRDGLRFEWTFVDSICFELELSDRNLWWHGSLAQPVRSEEYSQIMEQNMVLVYPKRASSTTTKDCAPNKLWRKCWSETWVWRIHCVSDARLVFVSLFLGNLESFRRVFVLWYAVKHMLRSSLLAFIVSSLCFAS